MTNEILQELVDELKRLEMLDSDVTVDAVWFEKLPLKQQRFIERLALRMLLPKRLAEMLAAGDVIKDKAERKS